MTGPVDVDAPADQRTVDEAGGVTTSDRSGPAAAPSRFGSWPRAFGLGALVTLAVIAVFRMETSSADFDPQYMRVLVERTVELGGSWYENGIHNKGPLEPAVYELALRLGGRDGFWLVIALFALVAAGVVGAACWAAARRVGARSGIGPAVAAVAVAHLTLSASDYAGVLYSRNITAALLAGAFAVTITDAAWSTARRRGWSVLAVGLAVGLAAQTVLTTALTGGALLLWAMWLRRDERVLGRPVWLALPVVSGGAFFSAPIGYRLLGPWDEFVDGWWTYARFMSTATGRSLTGQFELGWERFVDHHADRPEQVALLVAFVVASALRWRTSSPADRTVRLALATWWALAWIELVLSQRYSSHYYSILAVPLLLMLAVVGADASRRVPARWWGPALAPVVIGVSLVVTLVAGDLAGVRRGAAAASAYDDVHGLGERRAAGVGGRRVMTSAILDLYSDSGDPLLMWTSYPWPYLEYDRVSATRYIWKSFLLGEIYLARSGPEYVLPGTWEHFADDLAETDPTAFVVESVNPVRPDTPFAEAVEEGFTPVYVDESITVSLRNDLADDLADPTGTTTVDLDDDRLVAWAPSVWSDRGCVRLDAVVDLDDGAERLDVSFPTIGVVDEPRIAVGRDALGARSVRSTTPGRASFLANLGVARVGSAEAGGDRDGVAPSRRMELSVVVGDRAALVRVDGQVAGAVHLPALPPGADRRAARAVEVTAAQGGAEVVSLRRSDPPPGSGCDASDASDRRDERS